MIEIKQFSGILDTDSSNETINPTSIKMGRNIRFRNGRYEVIPGNRLVSNVLPAGNNECLGAFYDELRKRVYYFNFNSNDEHGIYVYYVRTGAIDKVAVVGFNTDGDIFEFNLDGPIYNVRILYGDDTQGDILYFNNSQKEPCQINVTRALVGDYGTIERRFIDVAKEPPSIPPYVTYEDDATVTVNNFRKRLVKIKARFIFGNKEKSVTSSESELPLPINYNDTDIDKDPTKNARIAIVIQTGSPEVKEIELLAAFSGVVKDGSSLPNQFGDFVSIATLNKSDLSISDDDLYTYRFFNDQAYVPIDIQESVQLQDLVPLEANALELLNGNVPIYGGIKEGFAPATILGSSTSTSESARTTQNPFVFAASQSGDSGFGSGQIHIVVIGTLTVSTTFNIYTTNQTISFTTSDITTAIAGLSAAAVLAGFTVISSDSENLVITKNGESLLRFLTVLNAVPPITNSFVYDWNSRYNFAIIYFDEKGRTIGARTNSSLPVQTVNYTETLSVENIPKIELSISNRPPIEARYFQILRTKNLSKSKFIYWITDRTFKDDKYAYVSIESLNTFITENPSSGYLAYSFSPNDRIRFVKVLSGSVNTIYEDQDFEILGEIFSPEISGIVQPGQFLKIALPTTSGTFDFGTVDFSNYFVQLYTPGQSIADNLNFYYEFGERYAIGNAGLTTRFHQGMLQNQSSDLVTPATFEFTKGDDYLRNRTINTGGKLNYVFTLTPSGAGHSAGRASVGVTFVDRSFTDSNVLTGNSPFNNLSGFNINTNDDRWIIKIVGGGPYTFRAKGTITVSAENAQNDGEFRFIKNNGTTSTIYYAVPPVISWIGNNQYQTFTFDFIFVMNSGERMFVHYFTSSDANNYHEYKETDLTITVQNLYTVGIIDENFSDYFESKVNSNGRAWIVDPNAAQTYFPTMIRWGLAYQVDTNLNQTNRFYELNFDEIDRAKGDIRRFKARERIMRIFQDRGCGQVGVYTKFIQDSAGTRTLTTTNDIITRNNINYYQGEYGLGGYPGSLVSSTIADYFIYPTTGEQIRLSQDGITVISRLYKGQYFIKNLLSKYNRTWTRANGSQAKLLGAFDYTEGDYISVLQGGASDEDAISDYAFSFNETGNRYHSFYDYASADWILDVDDKIFTFKNGQLYIHDNETTWSNFYGVQYSSSVTLVYNKDVAVKKRYMALAYQSNKIWSSPTNGDIKTSMINPQTGFQQISQLKDVDYEIQENIRYAALLKDANSMLSAQTALLQGDDLNGNWIECSLFYAGGEFSYLFAPYVNNILSPRNF